jgi:hypothetical protein
MTPLRRTALELWDRFERLAAHINKAAPIGPDLAAVVDAWPELPEAIEAGVLAMIKAARLRGIPPEVSRATNR